MEISELTLKLIIILIPGAISAMIFDFVTTHKEWTPFKFVVNAIVMGVFSYLLVQIVADLGISIYNLFSHKSLQSIHLQVWDSLSDSHAIPYAEVAWASISGILVAISATALFFHKCLHRVSRYLRISNKYGEENLFTYFLNAKEAQAVYIRSLKNNTTYFGFVEAYSETDEISELVLRGVSVYEYETSKLSYEIDQIYLSFAKNEVIIEIAIKKNDNETSTATTH